MDYIKAFEQYEKLLTQKTTFLNRMVEKSPPGRLRINKSGNRFKWYQRSDDGSRTYIPKKKEQLAAALAAKSLYKRELIETNQELKAITRFLKNHNKILFKSLEIEQEDNEMSRLAMTGKMLYMRSDLNDTDVLDPQIAKDLFIRTKKTSSKRKKSKRTTNIDDVNKAANKAVANKITNKADANKTTNRANANDFAKNHDKSGGGNEGVYLSIKEGSFYENINLGNSGELESQSGNSGLAKFRGSGLLVNTGYSANADSAYLAGADYPYPSGADYPYSSDAYSPYSWDEDNRYSTNTGGPYSSDVASPYSSDATGAYSGKAAGGPIAYKLANNFSLERWKNEEFISNQKYPEHLINKTVNGLMVRSKSEAFIATELVAREIVFRYECLLEIEGRPYYPDFTIIHPVTHEVIIWEHLGLMDKDDYIQKASAKLAVYMRNGIVPGINLIITSETDDRPLDFEMVRKMIEAYLE